MELADIVVNQWYRAKENIRTSKGVIKKGTRVQVASKQGKDVYVYFGHMGSVKVRPQDLKS